MDTAIQIKEVLMKSEEMFGADPQISSFEKSLQEFKKMVDSGVVKPRGYNIRTETHEPRQIRKEAAVSDHFRVP